ncbi:MAG: MoxR family ATPase [bacterium]|nr:MoxR family ATPase [bacterium]
MQDKNSKEDELKAVQEIKTAHDAILSEVEKVIVGQKHVVEQFLIALFSNGHCLLVGVPGLAKTLLINTLSKVLDLKFKRIQFTPDLMPSDIIGTDIIQEDVNTGKRSFKFLPGPIFGNIILADEINRTPPKTQAALLEAMQEYKVTAGGETYELKLPFFVLATQNPIEHEGTYPLPEAQLDRFMFNVHIEYPSKEEEMEIVKLTTSAYEASLKVALTGDDIIRLQKMIRKVPVSDYLVEYAVDLVKNTRPGVPGSPKIVKDCVSWGAGPRASQYLILGAKTRAVMHGRYTVTGDDIRAIAEPVLRHRIITNFNADADGIDSTKIIAELIEKIKEPVK